MAAKSGVFPVTGWPSARVEPWTPDQSLGLSLGKENGYDNRRTYVDPDWQTVELELEGAGVHTVTLPDRFWADCPEFRSAEITGWLYRNNLAPWPKNHPPVIKVLCKSEGRFKAYLPRPDKRDGER